MFLALLLSAASLAAAPTAPTRPTQVRSVDDEDEAPQKKRELPPDPSGKLYEKFRPSRGFWLGADVGLMWMFGGAERSYSNTQLYIGLDIGYDFGRWFSWQVHVGRGFTASGPRTENQILRIRDFAFTNFLTGPVVWIMVWERMALEVKAMGGLTLLDPVPIEESVDGVGGSPVAPVVGGSLGFKYLTLLTDFSIGLDATFYYIIYPVAMPVLIISPLVIRYTF